MDAEPEFNDADETGDPEGESFEEILETADGWAKRHEVVKQAKKDLDLPLDIPAKQLKITVPQMSVVVVPAEFED